jgi:hypothetical protein
VQNARGGSSRPGEPGKGVVRIGRWIGGTALTAAVISCLGCAHGPRRFGKIESPAPLVRARSVALGRRQPNSQVIPALISRLGDTDPVVRLAAHEELRRRTGEDFGYVPWASPEERSRAIDRWQAWLGGRNASGGQGAMASAQLMAPPAVPGKSPPANGGPQAIP